MTGLYITCNQLHVSASCHIGHQDIDTYAVDPDCNIIT